MDYSAESSAGQQNVTFTVAAESHLTLARDFMQLLSDQWDYLLAEVKRADHVAVEMIVGAIVALRQLARHLGIELSNTVGQGWAECSRVDVARSLLAEMK